MDQYGKTLDEDSGRAAWTIFCRLNAKDERYQRDEENFKAFLAAATKAGRAALKEERAAE